MHTHKQMETGRKCFFLMMLVLYIVGVHQGNIFHLPRQCWQQMARTTRFWAGGKAWEIRTSLVGFGFQTRAWPSCAATGTMRSTCQNLFKTIHMARTPYVTAPWRAGVQQQRLGWRPEKIFKGIVHPNIISLFTHPHAVTNQYHILCYTYNTKWDILRKTDKNHHNLLGLRDLYGAPKGTRR